MENIPNHIGVILDGNRRWARSQDKSAEFGHQVGMNRVKDLLNNCMKYNIKYLTVYAFSTENFKRDKLEVACLMKIFESALKDYLKIAKKEQIKVSIFGDMSKFNKNLIRLSNKLVEETKTYDKMYFNICLNYGGRAEIIKAVKEISNKVKNGEIDINEIDETLFSNFLYSANMPDPDFIIRTSGEQRLSNFLTWQSTYSELYFPKVCLPDFGDEEFKVALTEYSARNRRFGGN